MLVQRLMNRFIQPVPSREEDRKVSQWETAQHSHAGEPELEAAFCHRCLCSRPWPSKGCDKG